MSHALDPIFHPRTIAIIGASADPTKRGYRAIESLTGAGYSGEIIPINPKESTIFGFKCFPSLAAVPKAIDLAVVCTAAKTVLDVIGQCGEKGIKGAVLLAGGFSEASEAGRKLEEEAVAIARRYGVRLVGPNTNGIFSARTGCNTIGGYDMPCGPIAILSNSANVMGSLINEAQFYGHTGFSTTLSVGNQADILFHEYLECFGADPDTRAIISYVEGFKDGPAYMKVAHEVSKVKPIVMYAVGRTAEGKRAAKSHSGSLAGNYAVTSGVLRQAGVVLVKQSDHLLPVAEALTLFPAMRGRRVAVLSEGGGPITIATEALAERGLVLAQLTEETQARIHAIVPNASAINNPVDAGGGTEPRAEYYGSISQAILEDPNIDALLLVGFFGGYAQRYGESVAAAENQVCVALSEMMHRYGKPVMVQSRSAYFKTEALNLLRKQGVPFQRHIEVAVQCLACAADYQAAKQRLLHSPPPPIASCAPRAATIIENAIETRRDLIEPEAIALLGAYVAPVLPYMLMQQSQDASRVIETLGEGPFAVKIVSKDILHKSESGGVLLDVRGKAALQSAFDMVRQRALIHRPDADLSGVLVTPMAARGTEIIMGMHRDDHYGPVIVFGLGGVFVEVIRDVVFRALPLSLADAHEMIGELRHQAILEGARGAPKVDRAQLAKLLVTVSSIAVAHPEIQEIDLNPVIAHADGCAIVDARILLGDR